jgi:uncharacterized RDD family membrane protein YckC
VAEVVTGEAVILDVPIAAFPSRMAALLIDMLLQVTLLGALLITVVVTSARLNLAAITAIWTTASILIIVAYPTIFETLSRGKTLGKMALGLRVVGDDGSPERFRQALIRALAGIFEIWTLPLAPAALITSMLSARGKRLGDLFAGTYVIQERVPRRKDLPPVFAVVPAPLAGWAQVLELSRLSDQIAEAAGSYLRRYRDLRPEARAELGLRLATAVAAQVSPPPPPGTPPAAYLAAVLAVRREREHARLAAVRPAPPSPDPRLPTAPAAASAAPRAGLPDASAAPGSAGTPGSTGTGPRPEPQPGNGGFAPPR